MDTATSNTGGGSAFASDSSTNLATVIKGLKKFDGKDPAEFKTWMKKFCVVLGVTRKDILPLLKKQRKPDPADTAAFDSYTRANEDLYAILFLLVELPAALSIQKHEDDTGISGDGQAAFEELCNNYDRVTDEVIRAKMEELENNPMNPGENPDDYFNQKHLLRRQLDRHPRPTHLAPVHHRRSRLNRTLLHHLDPPACGACKSPEPARAGSPPATIISTSTWFLPIWKSP